MVLGRTLLRMALRIGVGKSERTTKEEKGKK